MKIPLAWLQLSHERIRLLIAIAGVAFADILIFMQFGFRDALYESNTLFHQQLNGELVLINPLSNVLHRTAPFPRRRLQQCLSVNSVKVVLPIYIGGGNWKNPATGIDRIMLVFGFDTSQPTLRLSEVNQNTDKLKLPDVVLFDRRSRPEFGPIASDFESGRPVQTELNKHRVTVGGLFSLGASFAADGNTIVSDSTFLRLFPNRSKDGIDLGVIQLKPGTDSESVRRQLEGILPKDVKVMTRDEFVDLEKNFWATSTAIGFIFTIGTLMGAIVGIVIVYQVLYSDVSKHLPEYATLKAMGYTQRYLLGVIFQAALILAALGYIPGFTISIGLYGLTKSATQLPIAMTLSRAIIVWVATVLMCSAAGALTMRRLRDADPADIF